MVAIQIITLVVVIIIVFLLFKFVKSIALLAINSVIGFFALYGVNIFLADVIPINFWSVAIVVIGGIFGLILELILHFFVRIYKAFCIETQNMLSCRSEILNHHNQKFT